MKNKPFFLKNVQLSGYKSIKNVDVGFENGLNIIIGKNAAGKTNFLSFLDLIVNKKNKIFFNFTSKLLIKGSDEYLIESNNKYSDNSIPVNFIIGYKILKNGKILKPHLFEFGYNTFLIRHGVPFDYSFIDKPLNFEIGKKTLTGLDDLFFNNNLPNFISTIHDDFFKLRYNDKSINKENIINVIDLISKKISLIKIDLQKYSNINDIRISDNHNIFHNKEKDYFSITNLFLEFKIENSWLPFSDLSDGTKRLFYIISEVAIHTDINENQLRIILLEEPELGIHPHQLHGLMQFLKEQAEDKQIIISTHSPQVLNILGRDDLNKIIIATSEGKKGTVLKHLTKEQKEKAKSYMNDEVLFLSDYWMYSDLEERV